MMLQRCENPDAPAYENYGARGIAVCDRWHHFRFFAEDMGIRPDPKLTIERVDNEGNYEPGNCIWDTRSNQCVNRRRFRNNTSGETGVAEHGDGFNARFDYEGKRFDLGQFRDMESAGAARDAFINRFFEDRDAAIASIPRDRVPLRSTSGLRGVTPHVDGGYICRATKKGVRHYLGYFQSAEEAARVRAKFLAS